MLIVSRQSIVARFLSTTVLGLGLVVGVVAGEKLILDTDQPDKVSLPDAATRREYGRGEFEFLDRKSSVSGVGGIPEIPYTMMPRSKKQMDLFDKQKNYMLSKPSDSSKAMTAEEAAGVRSGDWSGDGARSRSLSAFEQFISGDDDEGGVKKKRRSDAQTDFLPGVDPLGLDLGKTQLSGPFGRLGLTQEKKKDSGPQVETPDLFGGTMTSVGFALGKSQKDKDKEKALKSRNDFAQMLNPAPDKATADLAALKNPKGESSVDPLASFGSDPTRKELTPTSPIGLAGARGVEELNQRRDDLLAPFQQANRGRSALSLGTLDPSGSRFLNIGSSAAPSPVGASPILTPRPGVLEFPSRKF